MASNSWKTTRIYVEKNTATPFTEEDARKLMFNEQIELLFTQYKNDVRNNTLKSQLCENVKTITTKLGYPNADVTLSSKGFQIVSGNKRVITKGRGGSLATITWDE